MRRMLLRTCLSTCKLLNVRLEESNKVNARAHMFIFERNMWGKNMETEMCGGLLCVGGYKLCQADGEAPSVNLCPMQPPIGTTSINIIFGREGGCYVVAVLQQWLLRYCLSL